MGDFRPIFGKCEKVGSTFFFAVRTQKDDPDGMAIYDRLETPQKNGGVA